MHSLSPIYCLALLLSLGSFIHFEISPDTYKMVNLRIEDDSYLKIEGTTNINTFNCVYRGQLSHDTLSVNIRRTADSLFLDHALLNIEVAKFDCGNAGMNKDFRSLLAYEDHPFLRVKLNKLCIQSNQAYEAMAMLSIGIAGTSKAYEVPVQLEKTDGKTFYVGQQSLNITDFGITPPRKFLGMVVVDEEVRIDFKLNVSIL